MSAKEIFNCDGCGVQKQETNHWFVVTLGDVGSAVAERVLAIFRWTDETRSLSGAFHFCGTGCLSKFVSEQTSKGRTSDAAATH